MVEHSKHHLSQQGASQKYEIRQRDPPLHSIVVWRGEVDISIDQLLAGAFAYSSCLFPIHSSVIAMSSAHFYKWGAKFGGTDAFLIAEMKDMAEQNWRLKRMYAEIGMPETIC